MDKKAKEILENLIVIKRNGRRVSFESKKIAIAIKKGFDSVYSENMEKSVNEIYMKVLDKIACNYSDKENGRISIEEIQDIIEKQLIQSGYVDVYESFSKYRENRKNIRKTYDERRESKFIQVIEKLLDRLIYENGMTIPRKELYQYGKDVSKQYAKLYIIKRKYFEMIESSELYISNLANVPQGMTGYTQLDLKKALSEGLEIRSGDSNIVMKKPKTVEEAIDIILVGIIGASEEQFFGESIPAFDYTLEPFVLETFKQIFKTTLFQNLRSSDFLDFLPKNGIEREIEKIQSIVVDLKIFDQYIRGSKKVKDIIYESYIVSKELLEKRLYSKIKDFLLKLEILHIAKSDMIYTINMGTCVSPEGLLVSKMIIMVLEENDIQNIEVVYKVKKGSNLDKEDNGNALLRKIISLKKPNVRFAIMDSKQNVVEKDEVVKEAAYISGHRILDNNIDDKREIIEGRGMLSNVIINLVNIPLKLKQNGEKITKNNILGEIDNRLNAAKQILYDIFEEQSLKKKSCFPMLFGNQMWLDSDKIKEDDRLRRALKHGILEISFAGLFEMLYLYNSEKYNSKKNIFNNIADMEKIVKYMKKKCDDFSDELNLNIQLAYDVKDTANSHFIKTDTAIYGIIPNITDKEKYNISYMIDENMYNNMSVDEKIIFEGHFHKLLPAGHIIFFEKNEILKYNNGKEYEENMLDIFSKCIENNVGLLAIKE